MNKRNLTEMILDGLESKGSMGRPSRPQGVKTGSRVSHRINSNI